MASSSTSKRSPDSLPVKRSVSFKTSPATDSFTKAQAHTAPGSSSHDSATAQAEATVFEPSSPVAAPLPPSSTMSTSSLKPALKPSSRKLPPPEQYQHPDPLIRRLRLVDSSGNPINLKQYFRDCKVVALYFSSQWAGMPLKEYQKTITDFQSRHPHEFKVIYVSVDVDEEWYKAGVQEKPWVSMVWNDGSSMPSERVDSAVTGGFGSNTSTEKKTPSSTEEDADDGEADLPAQAKLYNDEDFLLATEIDIDASLCQTDTAGTSYLRPYSRVHLASKLDILAAPTLAIYHIPSKRLIERNVRMRRMQDRERAETWERWIRGEGAGGLGLRDALHNNRMMFTLSLVSIFYFCLVKFGGEEFNFIGRFIGGLNEDGASSTGSAPPPSGLGH